MRKFCLFISLLLLLAACNSHYDERRLQLLELQACNRADSLMTNDSLAQALVAYFDRHGTRNDRLLAHYLLGRTYADLGQTPQALEAYHDAVDQADTTASDCDFAILGRVYAQMSEVFYRQNLMQDYLACLEHSISYAWSAKDTMMALNEYAHKMAYYRFSGNPDSVISICNHVYSSFNNLGFDRLAATYLGYAIKSLLENQMFPEARRYMDIYESKSGYFDSLCNIQKGREAYYNSKGQYYLGLHKYDSAEFFYRKELLVAHDLNNQNLASLGLAKLFQQTNRPDSAAKYALYSYEMNDSVYAQMATHEVAQMQAMYDYSRHQKIAQLEQRRAEYERQKAQSRLYIIICIGFIVGLALFLLSKNRKREKRAYIESLRRLEKTVNEVVVLRSQAEYLEQTIKAAQHALHQQADDALKKIHELRKIIFDKEEEINQLQNMLKVSRQRYTLTKESAEERLNKSATYIYLHKIAQIGQKLTDDDWCNIYNMVVETLPRFNQFIISNKYALNQHEYQACILFRLHINAMSISNLLGVSPTTVTKVSKSIMRKLYNKEGNSKEVIEMLSELC